MIQLPWDEYYWKDSGKKEKKKKTEVQLLNQIVRSL